MARRQGGDSKLEVGRADDRLDLQRGKTFESRDAGQRGDRGSHHRKCARV